MRYLVVPQAAILALVGDALAAGEVEDRAGMYVLWRVVAANVRKMQAVEVVSIGEGWMAPVPEDLARLATRKAFQQEAGMADAHRKTRQPIVMGRAEAHSAMPRPLAT